MESGMKYTCNQCKWVIMTEVTRRIDQGYIKACILIFHMNLKFVINITTNNNKVLMYKTLLLVGRVMRSL